MPVPGSAVADLRRDLVAAAVLRQQFMAREYDRSFLAEGGRIIYAVDSAILHHIFPRIHAGAPEGGQPDSGYRRGNAKEAHYNIFDGPGGETDLRGRCRESESRLGAVISHYLVSSFAVADESGDAPPLLLLPGHDLEAYRLYDSIATGFRDQTRRISEAAAAAKELEKLQRSIQGGGSESDRFNRILEELFDIIYLIHEPHEKFHRFNRLLRDRRFVKLEQASNYKPYQIPALRLDNGEHVFADITSRAIDLYQGDAETPGAPNWWDDQLRKNVSKMYRVNDIVALSTLDAINRILRPKNVRAILFTLNSKIIEAGEGYFPFKSEVESPLNLMSFSDLYIRHPRSLLSEEGLSRPRLKPNWRGERSFGPEIEGWLDAMLNFVIEDWRRFWNDPLPPGTAKYKAWLEFRRQSEEHGDEAPIISNEELAVALEHNPSLHRTFIERWTRYAGRLSDNHSAASKMAERELGRSVVFGEGGREAVFGAMERIRDWVDKLTERSWSDFFNTAAETGLELVKVTSGPDVPIVWLAPQLVLRRKNAHRDSLSVLWRIDDVRRRTLELMASIGSVKNEKSLPDAYVRALGYGVIFAAVNRWEVTRLLALRAAHIARTVVEEGGDCVEMGEEIDGREAYYLLAVANRVLGDPGAAASALQEARSRLKPSTRSDGLRPVLTGLRFNVEALEQEASALWSAPVTETAGVEARAVAATDLIERALDLLDADPCSERAIQRQGGIATRSAMFIAVAVLMSHRESAPARAALDRFRDRVRDAVEGQRDEISEGYKNVLWLPLRDRALLQVAASAVGVTLPAEFQYMHRDVMALLGSSENSLHPRDQRRLTTLEAIVTRAAAVDAD